MQLTRRVGHFYHPRFAPDQMEGDRAERDTVKLLPRRAFPAPARITLHQRETASVPAGSRDVGRWHVRLPSERKTNPSKRKYKLTGHEGDIQAKS